MSNYWLIPVGLLVIAGFMYFWYGRKLDREIGRGETKRNMSAHKIITNRIVDDEGDIYDLEVEVRALKKRKK